MKTTRREFIHMSTAAGAGLLVLRGQRAYAFSQSVALQKFIQPLRGIYPFDPAGIPAALPDALSTAAVDHYAIEAAAYTDQLHPALPPTRLWGYADTAHGGLHRHLGGVIVAHRGKAVQMTMTNRLPTTHLLPVDSGLPGANQAQNRIAVHIHGGFIPWISDGGPHDWFDPAGNHGLSFLNNSVAYPAGPKTWQPGQAEYYWPMDLSARMLWYHDHAWGITRINAYAGIATALLIRDPNGVEGQLIAQGLPGYLENGGREIPLVVQDKTFWSPSSDPTYDQYAPGAQAGDLWYAYLYENDRWKYNRGRYTPPIPSCIPEFFGDTMLVNGTVYPTLTVEPRRYRFRLLNACNAKFLNLQLLIQDRSVDGITLDSKTQLPTNRVGPPIVQIGAEGGFLPAPVTLNVGSAEDLAFDATTATGNLVLAPAERADLIVDFKNLTPGTKLILYTDAPSPFPEGDPRNDYYPGAPKNPTVTQPGYGPNTRQLMQFVIGPAASPPDPPLDLSALAMEPAPLVPPGVSVVEDVVQLPPGVPVRQLTLNEDIDSNGRLIQRIGTNVPLYSNTFARNYTDAPTETVVAGTTEIWQVANLTGDTHPVHFHLVNVQILARQPFKADKYRGTPSYTGPARLPEPNEMGWKETVRMNPDEVTTIIAKFDLPAVPFTVPVSPRTGGNEYVYHCHILEHEEHDMMRPLVVMP